MKRWLIRQLAWQPLAGLPRVAANLRVLLPSEWLDGLAQQVLGMDAIAIAPYRRSALRWRIFELLPTLDDPQLRRYLEGEDLPRRRFQLADRLASLYGQYLVYRCDWLADWEAGSDFGAGGWQASLWRRLVADIGRAHRGQRMRELGRRLPSLPADPEQPVLHVFGVAHLPPDALIALQALSATRRVIVYFPDPCREHWSTLVDPRKALRELAERDSTRELLDGGAFREIGHPLLAALGRMGQHFCVLLDALPTTSDLRDRYDELAEARACVDMSLLERVQHSIRVLDPSVIARPAGARIVPLRDASLRVHACHTRLRELEVLKDALLDLLASHSGLHPGQIAVMAPNMALYARLIPVVFGDPGDPLLPWQLSDVALARSHPLLAAVRELLDLPTQRITRSQLLGLLALPAVARRFGLDPRRHQVLQGWLDRCHVAWGLDARMKQDFGAAAVDEHSFAFALDRMAAGLLVGHEDPDTLIDGQILPVDPVTGPEVGCLGALSSLLELLGEWRATLARTHTLAEWASQLRECFERLFEPDPLDPDETEALSAAMRLVARLGEDSRDAGVAVEVPWPVVREVLIQGLDGIPERQAFLSGGISFCGMVPLRSVPFEVVALLGLNDGEFPRARSDSGLDLMQARPRLGDRDNRSDDRYLFLEALMSARRALHLSYLGEGAQDGKPRNPALPLAELLGLLDQQHGLLASADGYDPPWRVRHPLQPFDAGYFDPRNAVCRPPEVALTDPGEDPRRYSYSRDFAGVRADPAAGDWRFFADALPLVGTQTGASIELKSLERFYRDPARFVCTGALKLSRAALEEEAPDDREPLDSAFDPHDRLAMELVQATLGTDLRTLPAQPPARFARSGRLPSGELGQLCWDSLVARAQPYLDLARSLPPFAAGACQPESVAIDLRIDGIRIVGSLAKVYRHEDALWLVTISHSEAGFKQILPLFLQWAALRLCTPQTQRCQLAMIHRDGKKAPALGPPIAFVQEPAQIEQGLRELLTLYRQAEHTAGAYYPRTSYAYAQADAAFDPEAKTARSPIAAARAAWEGSSGSTGERDYHPLYNQMLAGDESFIESPAFAGIARRLLRAISARTDAGEAA